MLLELAGLSSLDRLDGRVFGVKHARPHLAQGCFGRLGLGLRRCLLLQIQAWRGFFATPTHDAALLLLHLLLDGRANRLGNLYHSFRLRSRLLHACSVDLFSHQPLGPSSLIFSRDSALFQDACDGVGLWLVAGVFECAIQFLGHVDVVVNGLQDFREVLFCNLLANSVTLGAGVRVLNCPLALQFGIQLGQLFAKSLGWGHIIRKRLADGLGALAFHDKPSRPIGFRRCRNNLMRGAKPALVHFPAGCDLAGEGLAILGGDDVEQRIASVLFGSLGQLFSSLVKVVAVDVSALRCPVLGEHAKQLGIAIQV